MTFGARLGIHPDDLRRTYGIWSTADYAEPELDGRLANILPPWEDQTYRRQLRVKVRNPDQVPHAADSKDADLQRISTEEWSPELVLAALAPYH